MNKADQDVFIEKVRGQQSAQEYRDGIQSQAIDSLQRQEVMDWFRGLRAPERKRIYDANQ
jgi:hypothetical protein